MKIIDVVGAVIMNDKKEVLCALRSQRMSMPGFWEFPGGKVEPGEDPKAALMREIQEELGCLIEVGDFITDEPYEYPGVTIRLLTYYASIVHGQPKAKEHEKLLWLPKRELRTLHWAPADFPTIARIIMEAGE
jgi:8-oxo-dGTP diphosphatase